MCTTESATTSRYGWIFRTPTLTHVLWLQFALGWYADYPVLFQFNQDSGVYTLPPD